MNAKKAAALLVIAELLGMSLWFTASAVTPYLQGRWELDATEAGWLTTVVQLGFVAGTAIAALLNLAAILSVSIGLLNLFPVPLLDGGHLLYYGIEAVRGRPLSQRVQEIGFRFGLAIVFTLTIFTFINDIF